jgi:hypothetical protein
MRFLKTKDKERIKELESDVYKLNTVVKSLCDELGYAINWSLAWDEVDGVVKKAKDANGNA